MEQRSDTFTHCKLYN